MSFDLYNDTKDNEYFVQVLVYRYKTAFPKYFLLRPNNVWLFIWSLQRKS